MATALPFTLRPARPEDHAAIARLFLELGVDDLPPSREKFEQEMLTGTLVAESHGQVVGYTYTQTLEGTGYVRHVATAPQARGQGVARALMQAWAHRFRQAGCTEWCLNVKPDNTPARHLYESLGMRTTFRSHALRFPWGLLAHVPPGPATLSTEHSPAQLGALEQAFSLPAGLLTHSKALPGRVLLGAWESLTPVGLACFDPVFPGAYPFRAQSLSVTQLLVDACARYAQPGTPYMQLVVEGQEELARQLIEAGATLRLEILHYRGDLSQVQHGKSHDRLTDGR